MHLKIFSLSFIVYNYAKLSIYKEEYIIIVNKNVIEKSMPGITHIITMIRSKINALYETSILLNSE